MRTGQKFIHEIFGFSLKNIKRLEVKFDPFHKNAASVREFYQGATIKKRLKTNVECLTRAQVVCDNSDPLVIVQFKNDHKLVINSKYLESNHIVKIIKQFEATNQDVAEDD